MEIPARPSLVPRLLHPDSEEARITRLAQEVIKSMAALREPFQRETTHFGARLDTALDDLNLLAQLSRLWERGLLLAEVVDRDDIDTMQQPCSTGCDATSRSCSR